MIITLTTDFGLRDPYVAAMKGVICSIAPQASILDLSHEIAPQDILEGALFLAGALPYFPARTVHVVVVDPGVGTARRTIAIAAGGQYIICPDNGIATLFLRRFRLQQARVISNPTVMLDNISTTFHGRDIFAPAAAHLALGTPLAALGEEITAITTLNIPEPRCIDNVIRGEVLHIDRFGNLITNIHATMLAGKTVLKVSAAGCQFSRVHKTYADVPPNAPLVLLGSSEHLEIAVNQGNAHQALAIQERTPVEITLES